MKNIVIDLFVEYYIQTKLHSTSTILLHFFNYFSEPSASGLKFQVYLPKLSLTSTEQDTNAPTLARDAHIRNPTQFNESYPKIVSDNGVGGHSDINLSKFTYGLTRSKSSKALCYVSPKRVNERQSHMCSDTSKYLNSPSYCSR